MNQEEIKQAIIELQTLINKCEKEIIALQKQCKHPNKKVISKGDTGNYDPSYDRYWDDCSCPDCQKIWTENKRPSNYYSKFR